MSKSFLCVAALLVSFLTAAQDNRPYQDPTRPPSVVTTPAPAVVNTGPLKSEAINPRPIKRRAKPRVKRLNLSSVLVSAERRHAVINGKLLKEGQVVAGARVLRITAAGVTVMRFGRKQKLSLHRTVVKRRVVPPS